MTPARKTLPVAALLAASALLAPFARAQNTPDSTTLSALAVANDIKLAHDGAAWTTVADLRQGAVFEVEHLEHGKNFRSRVSVTFHGQKELMAEIIGRDGTWYVSQSGRKEKFRPFEAPMDGIAIYLWLELAKPHFYNPSDGIALTPGPNTTVSLRMVLPPASRTQITQVVEQFRQIIKNTPAAEIKPESRQTLAQLEDLLAHGIERRMDPQTGLVTYIASPKMTIAVKDFRFLNPADEKSFDVTDTDYKDRSAPMPGKKENLLMMGASPTWSPGHTLGDLDLDYLSLATGEFRRIPYAGPAASSGCFSPDRDKVYISGANADGVMSIFEVNLKTGSNRPLLGPPANTGINMFPTLSPDGKLLAYMHKQIGSDMLNSQIVVLDLATGKARPIGEPADFAVPTWAAGDRLVVPVREKLDLTNPENAHKVASATICTLDLAGKLTPVVKGSMCAIVGHSDTILYETEDLWRLCSLDGKNDRLLGDGMDHCSFPAASPDGDRVLLMRYAKGKAPQPVIVRIDDGTVQTVNLGPGFWGMPAWK